MTGPPEAERRPGWKSGGGPGDALEGGIKRDVTRADPQNRLGSPELAAAAPTSDANSSGASPLPACLAHDHIAPPATSGGA
jgi:hypothetical protein